MIIFVKIKNFDVNYEFTIFKPSSEQNDIDYRYKNKNKYIILKTREDEMSEQLCPSLYRVFQDVKNFLLVAIQKGNIDIIQLLINIHSINLNIKSIYIYKRKRDSDDSYNQYYVIRKEKTILNEAVESGFLEIVQFLLKQKLFNIKEKLIENKECQDCTSIACTYYDKKTKNHYCTLQS